MFEAPETDRRAGDIVRQGVVCEISGARCRVRFSEGFETDWIAMPMARAGRLRIWSQFTAGERVMVSCPDGDHEAAAIVTALPSSAFPAPADPHIVQILVDDGSRLTYDPTDRTWTLDATDTGKILLRGGKTKIQMAAGEIRFEASKITFKRVAA